MTPRRAPVPVAPSLVAQLLTLAYLIVGDRALAERIVVRTLATRTGSGDGPAHDETLHRTVVDRCLRATGPFAWRSHRAEPVPDEAEPASDDAGGAAETSQPAPPEGGRAEPPDHQAELRTALWQLLPKLKPRHRAAVVLRWFDDRTDPEVADLLDMAPQSVDDACDRGLWLAREVLRHEKQAQLLTPGARPAPAAGDAAFRLLHDTLHDPARRLEVPADLRERVGTQIVARRRVRGRVVLASLLVLALVAGAAVLHARTGRTTTQAAPVPSAASGLLPWAPRGPLKDDAALIQHATRVWQQSDPRAPQRSYVLWAGVVGEGRLVVLQGISSTGRPRVGQLGEGGGQPPKLVLQDVADLPATDLAALVLTYDGNLDPALGLSAGPGWAHVQLLVAPRLVPPSGGPEVLDVRSRARDAVASLDRIGSDFAPWHELRLVADGLTDSRLQPDSDRPFGTLWRLARLGARPREVVTVGAMAGQLLPVVPAVRQDADVSGSELADPDVLDDALAAGWGGTTPAADTGRPVTIRALTVPPAPGDDGSPLRVSLLELQQTPGERTLLLVAREGGQVLCQEHQALPQDPALLPVVGAACLIPGRGGQPRVAGAAWVGDTDSIVTVTMDGQPPGRPSTVESQLHGLSLGLGPGAYAFLHTITSGTPPLGMITWSAASGGRPATTWVSPPLRAR